MIRVKALGALKRTLGKVELELDEDSIRVADLLLMLQELSQKGAEETFSSIRKLILINGVEISVLENEQTLVKRGDEVVLLPITHGG